MIDPTKTTPEKLAEMNDSLIVDNNHLRARVKTLERQLAELQLEDTEIHRLKDETIVKQGDLLAERDAEIAKLQAEADPEALHIAYLHGQADRNQTIAKLQAEIAKYRDAPVVAYLKTWNSVGLAVEGRQRVDLTDYCEPWLANMFPKIEPLIVKPGEQ